MARSATTYARPRTPLPPRSAPAPTWMRDDQSLILVAALVWLAFFRVVVPGFFDYSDKDLAIIQNSSGSIGNQIIWLSLVLVPLILLRSRLQLTWMLLGSVNGWFMLLTLYACASMLWSIDPDATFRRLSHLIGVYVVCATVCLVGWDARRFQRVLRPAVTAMLVGSIIFGLVRPDLAISNPDFASGDPGGHWRGLTNHKNALGSVASFGAILWFHALLYKDAKWWAIVVGLASSVACLYLSGSSTSQLGSLVVMLFLLLAKFTPPPMRSYMTPIVITVVVAAIGLYVIAVMKIVPGMDTLISPITGAVGKDTTFSGRTPIWELIKTHIQQRPMTGTGYGAFWVGPFNTSPSYVFVKRLYFYPGEAHNGYLDIINDLGYVGLLLLAGFVVRYFVLSFRLLKIDRTQALLYFSLIFYFLLSNLTESTWVSVGPNWMIFAMAVFAMSRQLLDQRLHAAHGDPLAATSAAPQKAPAPDTLATRYRTMTQLRRR